MFSHKADDVVLNTPLIAEPIKGKMAIRQIVEPLLEVIDAFDFREIMHGPVTWSRSGQSNSTV